MVTIDLYDHPFGEPTRIEAECVAAWLLEYSGRSDVRLSIYRGQPCLANDVSLDSKALLDTVGHFTALQSPGAPVVAAVGAWAWTTWVAVASIAIGVYGAYMASRIGMPGNVNRTQQSKNNALGERTNDARLLERIEDIYGEVRSYPALLSLTYTKYVAHRQTEFSYMSVGRGWFDISDVREGDTLYSDINGSSCRFFSPFTMPGNGAPFLEIGDEITEPVLTTYRSSNVTGATLTARNQFAIRYDGTTTFAPIDAASDKITMGSSGGGMPDISGVGDTVTVEMDEYIIATTSIEPLVFSGNVISSAADIGEQLSPFAKERLRLSSIGGEFTVVSHTSNTITVEEDVSSIPDGSHSIEIFADYSGSYTIETVEFPDVGASYLAFAKIPVPRQITTSAVIENTTARPEWTDWVAIRKPDITAFWVNIIAPNGMFKDDGGGKESTTVTFQAQYQQIDDAGEPVGDAITLDSSLSGATSNERARTFGASFGWTGPTRFRVRRVNFFDYDFDGTVIDEIKWRDLEASAPVDVENFGDITTVQTVAAATSRALSVSARKFNCNAAKKLPIYDGSGFSGEFAPDGSIASGTISATKRFIDIVAAAAADPLIGRRNVNTDIDLPQIYSVYQQVAAWNPLCAEFSYTLDSDNISFEETVQMIATACFCMAYRQNGKIRFSFDRAQAESTALFTHRNKRPASDKIDRSFSADGEIDGIELSYNDAESDAVETIVIPLDGSGTNLKKMEVPGIRNFAQAWMKANREYQRIKYQRVAIETEATSDGMLLLPNQRIDIVDNTRFDAQDGEVIAQNGLEITVSRDLTFSGGDGAVYIMTEDGFALATEAGEYIIMEEEDFEPASHSIMLMRRDGSLESIPVTAGASANKLILAYPPSEAINTVNGGGIGVRTIFSFGADSEYGANSYLVQEIAKSDAAYVKVIAINYDASYYSMDDAPIPARETVL